MPAPFTDAFARALAPRGGGDVARRRRRARSRASYSIGSTALLREAYCLVRDGVASVEDVARVVRDGLRRRWAVVGPFETAELNTRGGIASHAEKMRPAYARMAAERGQSDPWTPELVARVAAELHERLPAQRWEERVAWRNDALIVLERARRASGLFAGDGAEGAA